MGRSIGLDGWEARDGRSGFAVFQVSEARPGRPRTRQRPPHKALNKALPLGFFLCQKMADFHYIPLFAVFPKDLRMDSVYYFQNGAVAFVTIRLILSHMIDAIPSLEYVHRRFLLSLVHKLGKELSHR